MFENAESDKISNENLSFHVIDMLTCHSRLFECEIKKLSKHVQNLSICNLSKYFSSQHQHYLRKLPSEFQDFSVKDKKDPKKYFSNTQKLQHFEVEFEIGSRDVFVQIMIHNFS